MGSPTSIAFFAMVKGIRISGTIIGYDEKAAIEMAQIISFCIWNNTPLIVGENAATGRLSRITSRLTSRSPH